MPIVDSRGNPLPATKVDDAKPRTAKARIAAVAASVAAVALFVGNVDRISSTVSDWIYGKKEKPQTVVIQITRENLLAAAQQLTETADNVEGAEKTEAKQAAQNLNTAANKLTGPISINSPTEKSPPWLLTAMKELGQQEIPGEQHNQRILEYIRSVSPSLEAKGDEFPWTSFFVNWSFMQSGIKGTNSGGARSWLKWGVPLDQPKPGAVAVFRVGEISKGMGYVSFYIGDAGDYVICIGGNVGNAVRISAVQKSRLLGYRWPQDS